MAGKLCCSAALARLTGNSGGRLRLQRPHSNIEKDHASELCRVYSRAWKRLYRRPLLGRSLKRPGPDGTAGRTAVSQGSPRRACLVPFEHLAKDTDGGGAHPALGKGHAVQTPAFCSMMVSSAPWSPSSPETCPDRLSPWEDSLPSGTLSVLRLQSAMPSRPQRAGPQHSSHLHRPVPSVSCLGPTIAPASVRRGAGISVPARPPETPLRTSGPHRQCPASST